MQQVAPAISTSSAELLNDTSLLSSDVDTWQQLHFNPQQPQQQPPQCRYRQTMIDRQLLTSDDNNNAHLDTENCAGTSYAQ